MRSIKPLKKLAGKALAAHSRHRNRHRPTGCSFALSERVNYLDSARWDELVAGHSVFLSRQYLQVLEEAGPITSVNDMHSFFTATNLSPLLWRRP
jgi:hypothetical protein